MQYTQTVAQTGNDEREFSYLHERGIRTTYFVANDEETLRLKVAEGHDFVFTDRYSPLRAVYDEIRRNPR